MWRGGLSGPRSLFLHADRPLISENGTSTLTHELTHVFTRIRGADGDDWIAEGMAEFYSIELLRRAGLLSDARADRAHDWMRSYGRNVESLTSDRSSGRRTARAVQLFRALDREIRSRTRDEHSLDDVVRALMPAREVSREDLREQVEELTGSPSKVLATALLD
jgi:predicted metalloprotease with PDZ domain